MMEFVAVKLSIVLALLAIQPSAVQPCKPIKHTIKVDRAAVKQVQIFVNEGHEPWRMDAQSVAAERILFLRKVKRVDYDALKVSLEQVTSGETRATFKYKDTNKTYRVTVQRYAWLLPLAKQWRWSVWTPTEEEIIPGCEEPGKNSALQSPRK